MVNDSYEMYMACVSMIVGLMWICERICRQAGEKELMNVLYVFSEVVDLCYLTLLFDATKISLCFFFIP